MCLGSIIGSCLASCCAGCCCSALSDCKAKHGPASRLIYIFLMFISCIFAVVMSLYGEKELYSNDLFNVNVKVCNSDSCAGAGSVYRTSFTLFIFFLIHFLIIWKVPSFHWLFLTIKLLCFAIFLTITFWIPKSFFDGYAEFARVASIFFLILQVLVLIIWAWDVNQRLIDKITDLENVEEPTTETKGSICLSKTALVGGTLLINVGVIILWVFFFQWFIPDESCSFNKFVVGFTITLVIILTSASCYFPHASIFTAAVVSFYITYLCYAALSAYPSTKCNEFATSDNNTSKDNAVLWIGLLITAAAISYTGFSVSSNSANLTGAETHDGVDLETADSKKNSNNNKTSEEGGAADEDNADAVADSNYNDAVEKDKEDIPLPKGKEELEQRDNLRFHLCMAFAAIYMSMLYTNWGTDTTDSSTAQGRGKTALWINLSAQYVAIFLYLWTLVAPRLCPERFGQQDEDD